MQQRQQQQEAKNTDAMPRNIGHAVEGSVSQ